MLFVQNIYVRYFYNLFNVSEMLYTENVQKEVQLYNICLKI